MVTGDNLITAKAIAKDVGILKDDAEGLALEGT
jgi:magnesium-transporting ATPase (P-type)